MAHAFVDNVYLEFFLNFYMMQIERLSLMNSLTIIVLIFFVRGEGGWGVHAKLRRRQQGGLLV